MTPMRARFGGLLGAATVLVAVSPVAATASEVRLTSAPSARAFATSASVKRAGASVGKSNRAIGGALIPIILGSAFLASLAPAEAAVRGSLVEALEYE